MIRQVFQFPARSLGRTFGQVPQEFLAFDPLLGNLRRLSGRHAA
jgi:hypothetical protein